MSFRRRTILISPRTGHESILSLGHTGEGAERFEAFRLALLGRECELRKHAMSREEIHDMLQESHRSNATADAEMSPADRKDPEMVVFVIHGIRDFGFWTRRLAIQIKKEARNRNIACETITS